MTHVEIDTLVRRFGVVRAVDGVTLDLPAGSFTALLGPSGCGKSTLLRMIAGFEAPDEGSIRFDGRLVADPRRQVAPEQRGVGVVFQSYALWPHMTVAGNVGYPLRVAGAGRSAIDAAVADVLSTVGLAGLGGRAVDELSGGQRQRVALARCLIARSRLILFDEPLANLDMHLRAAMIDVFRAVHRQSGATIVYVTHDQAEALALADRIAVLDRGRILQLAPPRDIYRAPADRRVAGFVGRGAMIAARVVEPAGAGRYRVAVGDRVIEVRGPAHAAGDVALLLRPEALRLAGDGLDATVVAAVYRGPVHELRLRLRTGDEVTADSVEAPAEGAPVRLAVDDGWIVPPER